MYIYIYIYIRTVRTYINAQLYDTSPHQSKNCVNYSQYISNVYIYILIYINIHLYIYIYIYIYIYLYICM